MERKVVSCCELSATEEVISLPLNNVDYVVGAREQQHTACSNLEQLVRVTFLGE